MILRGSVDEGGVVGGPLVQQILVGRDEVRLRVLRLRDRELTALDAVVSDLGPRVILLAQARLVDGGGGVMMELGEYPHSARYAWIRDRFGVTWQLMLTNPSGEDRPFLTPSFMFGGANQDKAREATDFWISVIDASARGALVEYDHGAVMFTDFRLADEWFAAMDSAVPQDTTFNEGISLLVEAEPGAELDRLWNELSSDPAAEQCGWCKDRWGLSWQITPRVLSEGIADPDPAVAKRVFEAMMTMRKIDVAAIEAARRG